jgi:hypothetical protein
MDILFKNFFMRCNLHNYYEYFTIIYEQHEFNNTDLCFAGIAWHAFHSDEFISL